MLQNKQAELRSKLSWWKSLSGTEFERELVQHYRRKAFSVEWTGGSGDQGVDFFLRDKKGRKIIVQAKCHRSYISPSVVRDLFGALMHHGADEAWLVTTSGFHRGARSFADGKPIRLLTIRDILDGKESCDVMVQVEAVESMGSD